MPRTALLSKPQSILVSRKKIEVRNSSIHGKGVFALVPIAKGTRLVEYKGPRITDDEAEAIYGDSHDDGSFNHTFLFSVAGGMVIDATRVNTTAKWINHSCDPNCEAIEDEHDRVWIEAIRDIAPGEELAYDYNIILDTRHTAAEKARFKCLCGSKKCRGTLLADKRKFRR